MLKNTTEFKKKKNKLSSTLLNLKFMLKTKERIEKDDERKCSEQVLKTEPEDGISYTDYKIVPYAECCELIDGRLSFRGTNREIEPLLGIATNTEVIAHILNFKYSFSLKITTSY